MGVGCTIGAALASVAGAAVLSLLLSLLAALRPRFRASSLSAVALVGFPMCFLVFSRSLTVLLEVSVSCSPAAAFRLREDAAAAAAAAEVEALAFAAEAEAEDPKLDDAPDAEDEDDCVDGRESRVV